jgi:hypothetical protein
LFSHDERCRLWMSRQEELTSSVMLVAAPL